MATTTTPVKPSSRGKQARVHPSPDPRAPLKARVASGDYGTVQPAAMSHRGRGRC
jgi:hypothetical protein